MLFRTPQILITIFLTISCLTSLAEKKEMTVIIDPGHGGQDAGATYRGIKEKDVVLSIGLKLGQHIRETYRDVKVVYTRDKDVFVPLHQRAAIANKHKADLFISLHANACGTPSISGTETFILGLHRSQENLDVAKKENAVILFEEDHSERYEGFDPNSTESYIMFELIQDEFLEQSASFAKLVQEQFKHKASRYDRGVKQAGFLVLRQTGMPSVLVEAGFLSNPTEAKFLESENGQNQLASAIFKAFSDYKSRFDAKSDFNLHSPNTPQAANTQTNKQPNPDSTKKEINQVAEPIKEKPDTSTQKLSIATTQKADNNKEQAPTPSLKNNESPTITFAIQIAAGQTNVAPLPANFKGLKGIRKIQFGKVFKYYYGNETTLKEAENLKNQIQSKFPGCFIVAFKNDEIIPVQEAVRLSEQK